MRNPWLRRVFASGTMVLGSAVVLLGVVEMNAKSWEPPKKAEASEVSFDIAPKQPKKKPKKKRSKPKKKRNNSKAPPRALIPTAGGGGPAFDLPGLSDDWFADELGDLADRAGGGAISEDALDKLPVPTKRVAPEFPSRARSKNVSGFVKLTFLVGLDGRVSEARVLEAQPAGMFDQAALDAIGQWSFEPGEYEGQPVASRMTINLRFELE